MSYAMAPGLAAAPAGQVTTSQAGHLTDTVSTTVVVAIALASLASGSTTTSSLCTSSGQTSTVAYRREGAGKKQELVVVQPLLEPVLEPLMELPFLQWNPLLEPC